MDDMMREAIASKREDNDGLFAIAWALTKLADNVGMLNSNYVTLQNNQNYALKQAADNLGKTPTLPYNLDEVFRRLTQGTGITIKLN